MVILYPHVTLVLNERGIWSQNLRRIVPNTRLRGLKLVTSQPILLDNVQVRFDVQLLLQIFGLFRVDAANSAVGRRLRRPLLCGLAQVR